MAAEFVGRGIGFPVKAGSTGALVLVGDDTEIRQSIQLILGTAFGERPMRPEFGCGVHDLVFDASDGRTAGRAAYEVRASLARWETRIDVLDVEVTFPDAGRGVMHIAVTYTVRGTNDPRNLVFPFYLIGEEGTRELLPASSMPQGQ
jgi:phage baseplate assembly protein W